MQNHSLSTNTKKSSTVNRTRDLFPEQKRQSHDTSSSSMAQSQIGFNFSQIPLTKSSNFHIQPKLKINAPNDRYEKEADHIADQVMRMGDVKTPKEGTPSPNIQQKPLAAQISPLIQRMPEQTEEDEEMVQTKALPNIQRKCAKCGEEESIQQKPLASSSTPVIQRMPKEVEEDEDMIQTKRLPNIQRKCAKCEEEEKQTVQTKTAGQTPQTASSALASRIQSTKGHGQAMDASTNNFMSSRFGTDFSGVRIHTDSTAAGMSQEINAQAFTVGQDVYFNRGRYSPNSSEGKRLLAHELVHTVQQGTARKSSATKEKKSLNAKDQKQIQENKEKRVGSFLYLSNPTKFNINSIQPQLIIQKTNDKRPSIDKASYGELAWEIFSPVVKSAIRSLTPKLVKGTSWGKHNKEIIDIVDKVEGSYSKMKKYEKVVRDIKKPNEEKREKFTLKSIGKVYKHIKSIPESIEISGENLINEGASVVNFSYSSNLTISDLVAKLDTYVELLTELKKLKSPYKKMIGKLNKMEHISRASFDALHILAKYMLEIAEKVPNSTYQAWAFGMHQTLAGYRRDVGKVISELRHKRKGYENAIKAANKMESFYDGKTGRAAIEKRYRNIKKPNCLNALPIAVANLPEDDERFHEEIHQPYEFNEIMDAVDFLPIHEWNIFGKTMTILKDYYPNKKNIIDQKEERYQLAIDLIEELEKLRPVLKSPQAKQNPIAIKFILKEYYHFWVDDVRNPLSNTMFTYNWQVEQMIDRVFKLPHLIGSMNVVKQKNNP